MRVEQRINYNKNNMDSEKKGTIGGDNEEIFMFDRPVSPTGQYFSSSVLSVSILGFFECEVPVDVSIAITLLKNVFLPINPSFSSLMVTNEKGVKYWKSVSIKLEDHVKVPIFPDGLSPESYDLHLQEYISKITMDQLPQTKPLWELHIINYPTSNAVAMGIFKLHHALGDGYSLMGAILSCTRRADDPSLPLTFPSLRPVPEKQNNVRKSLSHYFSVILNTTVDFVSSSLTSTVLSDGRTPIRSGTKGVEFLPITISTTTFPLDHIKKIKVKIRATVNDIVVGTVFYGLRLYMQKVSKDSKHVRSTALVLLNTRAIGGYNTVDEMLKPNTNAPWGNHFAFMHVSIPKSKDAEIEDPLKFISGARKTINKKKRSLGVFLTGKLLDAMRKLRGAETTSRYVYRTLKNTSLAITNVMGPIEKIAVADYPCSGMYFMVVNGPQSLTITMMSYMGKLRLAVGAEKDYIDQKLLMSCFDQAFQNIFQAALTTKTT